MGRSTRAKLNEILKNFRLSLNQTSSQASVALEEVDDFDDSFLDALEEFWTSADQFLTGLDIALAATPLPGDEVLLAGGIAVKKGVDGLLYAWQYSKYVRFLWNGFRITDEAFSGFLRLERAARATESVMPEISRGLRWAKDMAKTIGLDKFQCIECQYCIRRIDGILKETVYYAGKIFNKGDILEFKDWDKASTLKNAIAGRKLLDQLTAYIPRLGDGNKIRLIFRQAQDATQLQKLTRALHDEGIDHLIEIVNGI